MTATASTSHVGPGTLFVAPGTPLPADWRVDPISKPGGWQRVTNIFDPLLLEAALGAEGWTFFFLAGALSSSGFGWAQQSMFDHALARLIKEVKQEGCNCLEINLVRTRSMLGIPYVRIDAHQRHIQKGMVFAST